MTARSGAPDSDAPDSRAPDPDGPNSSGQGAGENCPGRRLILAATDTPVERELIERWVVADQSGSGPADVIDVQDAGLIAQRLRDGDDLLLVPVRITWLPKERDGKREFGLTDLLAFRDPRRPRGRSQSKIVERDIDRYRVVVGEPARVSQLRARFVQHSRPVITEPPGPAEPGRGPDGPVCGPEGPVCGPDEPVCDPDEPVCDPDDQLALAGFVVRQATLALERAERVLIGDRYKVPRLVVEEITTGSRYNQRIGELASRLCLPRAQVSQRATEALQELVAVQSRLAIDLFGTAMRPLHARAWHVRAQAGELDRLRELNRRSALIFLPSHRSYADTLVLAGVLHEYDFPRNHVVGGDNLAVWPFAPLARRAGLVFIRRSFRGDEIYKLAIQEYFGYLVAKRFNLEWYLEGGRSRTGKLRPPRFGLLTYVAGALRNDPTIDVQLVPVSITYERLHEVTSMAAEQRGAAKQREGLSWLARYVHGQRRAAGDAVVRFGAPVNMRQRLEDYAAGQPPSSGPGVERLALNKLAFEVAVGINRVTPVLPGALVTLALLGVRDRALTLDQVQRILVPLLNYVQARRLPESGLALLRHPGRVGAALDDLVREGVVTSYTGGDEPVYSITPGQHLVAAFYRNNSIHWFVTRAIVELSMIATAERWAEPDAHGDADRRVVEAWADALRLRDLLKYEFFFPDKEAFRAELIAELELMDPQWPERIGSAQQVHSLLASSGFLVAHRVLRSFIEAELVVAERLVGHGGHALIDEKSFLAECAGAGQQMLLQGRVLSAEALSGELFSAALRLAGSRDLLEVRPDRGPDNADLGARRRAFAAAVQHIVDQIGVAAGIDAEVALD